MSDAGDGEESWDGSGVAGGGQYIVGVCGGGVFERGRVVYLAGWAGIAGGGAGAVAIAAAALDFGGLINSEDVEGLGVGAAGEESLYGFEEELVVGGGVREEGHGGVKFDVVGGAEDVVDGEGSGGEHELGAFGEARAEDGVGEVGGGFGE